MNFKHYLLLLLILFMNSCCDDCDDDGLLCNTQDPASYCYIPPPSANIFLYSPHQLKVIDDLTHFNDEQLNNAESLEITRISSNNDDTTFTVPIIDKSFEFLDNVIIGESYQYEMAYINFDGDPSELSTTELLTCTYEGVQGLTLELINESQLNINWSYDYSNYFSGPVPDEVYFRLIKDKQGSESEIFDLPLLSDIIDYTYVDTDIYEDDILNYSMYMIDSDIYSETEQTESIEINFPDCFISNYIPLNSYTIYLEWECSDVINENLPRITLRNEHTPENELLFDIENSQGNGFFIDTLSLYYDDIDDSIAGSPIQYQLEWQGVSGVPVNDIFYLETFPVHHMTYVPSLNEFPIGLDSLNNLVTNTTPFYIDKYEITNTQMVTHGDNPYEKWDDSPYNGGVSYVDALEYCGNRTAAFESAPNFEGLEFTLPDEIDWEIAASAEYQDINMYGLDLLGNSSSIYLKKHYYPVSVGDGLLNCNYANIQSCYGGSLPIGTFNGNNYENAISPSGLYDCSGNVKEWVKKSDYINHEDQRKVLRGGDYNSEPTDAKNISFIYENDNIAHSTFGFRTIIYADEYLQNLRGSYDKK